MKPKNNRALIGVLTILAAGAALGVEHPAMHETAAQRDRRKRTDEDLSERQRKRQAKMARRAAKHAAENKTTGGDASGGDQ